MSDGWSVPSTQDSWTDLSTGSIGELSDILNGANCEGDEGGVHNKGGRRRKAPTSDESNSKYWCFTSYTDRKPSFEGASYVVYQRELCPESKREHWQGYIEFSQKKRFSHVKRIIQDDAVHLELRAGTAEQAATYCKKAESRVVGTSPFEWGTISKPVGNSFEAIVKRIRSGERLESLIDDYPSEVIRYQRGIQGIQSAIEATSRVTWSPVKVSVLWGPTGVGKTRWVMDYATGTFDGRLFRKSYTESRQSWWDGYNGQELILIDDFEGKEADIEELLHLLDGYGHTRAWQVKGGSVFLKMKEVIFTSNSDPFDWYSFKTQAKRDALMRRINKIVNLNMGAAITYDSNKTLLD